MVEDEPDPTGGSADTVSDEGGDDTVDFTFASQVADEAVQVPLEDGSVVVGGQTASPDMTVTRGAVQQSYGGEPAGILQGWADHTPIGRLLEGKPPYPSPSPTLAPGPAEAAARRSSPDRCGHGQPVDLRRIDQELAAGQRLDSIRFSDW